MATADPVTTRDKILVWLIPAFFCAIACYFGPWAFLDGLTRMPAGLGDSRLNAFFLENVYRYLVGDSASLWHLPIYHPAPYALGFSDNHFGSAPIYAALRFAGLDALGAYQWWFLAAYPLNFFAAVWFGRRLGLSTLGATLCGLIYAFALPVTAQIDHSQLMYRCAAPFALGFFIDFLADRRPRDLSIAIAATVAQLFIGVYIGFFTLLFLAALLFARSCLPVLRQGEASGAILTNLWRGASRWKLGLVAVAALLALVWLFYPYVMAKSLYGVSRSWGEVRSMLPRFYSYFVADHALYWPSSNWALTDLPMRHEHQLFPGLAATLLAAAGSVFALRRSHKRQAALMVFYCLVTVMVVTLFIGWYDNGEKVFANSFWQLFVGLPLASAIRAMSRVVLVMLLPIGFLAGLGATHLLGRAGRWSQLALVAILLVVIAESSAVTTDWSLKAQWQGRQDELVSRYGDGQKGQALFIAQTDRADFSHEIDAMVFSQARGLATLNGYSGGEPHGFRLFYGTDCRELPRRVLAIQHLLGKGDEFYRRQMAGVTALGFAGCDERWWQAAPDNMSYSDRSFTAAELDAIAISVRGAKKNAHGDLLVELQLTNKGTERIAALGPFKRYVQLEYWFEDAEGDRATRFKRRDFLPEDLPPGKAVTVTIVVPAKRVLPGHRLKVNFAQRNRSGKDVSSKLRVMPALAAPSALGG